MKKLIVTIIMTIVAISGDAQNRYCNTYEDFLEGKWQQLLIAKATARADRCGGEAATTL